MKKLIYGLMCIGICMLSCNHSAQGYFTGMYQGDGVKLCLNLDSTAVLHVRYHNMGHNDKGRWHEDQKYIIIDFPRDSTNFEDGILSIYFEASFESETIILEKRNGGKLEWRNRCVLTKEDK